MSSSVPFGAGGGSRTHFSHPFLDAYYGLLRDVSAARRLSRSAFGGQCQPRPRAPGNLDRVCRSRISLLKTWDAFRDYASISFHTSLATRIASSSVGTFPINSLPVLKTDTL